MDSVSVKSEKYGAYLKLKTRVAKIDLSSEEGSCRNSRLGKNMISLAKEDNQTSTMKA